MKSDSHLGRCYLKGRQDDANAILSAVDYNLHLVLAWLRILLRVALAAYPSVRSRACRQIGFLTDEK